MGVKDEQLQKQKQRSQVRQDKAPRFNDNQFVRYELDKVQQAECKAWQISADDVLEAISALIDDGYRMSVKWDDYSESYACFLQDSDGSTDNLGLILTGRGSTVVKCIKQLLYKHHTCLAGQWGEYVQRAGRDAIDD